MKLIMLQGKQVVDSLPLNPLMLLAPEFLSELQGELLKRNTSKCLTEEPQFAIEGVPSKMLLAKTASPVN